MKCSYVFTNASLTVLYSVYIIKPSSILLHAGTHASTPWACLSKPLQTDQFQSRIACNQNQSQTWNQERGVSMNPAVNCAVKADRAIRCPICQRGRLLNAAEHTDLRSLQLFRPEQADRAQWFSKCPKCGQQIGIAICPVEVII